MDFTFVFHWKGGKTEEGKGKNPADAFMKLGYGAGALPALDYWEEKKQNLEPKTRKIV